LIAIRIRKNDLKFRMNMFKLKHPLRTQTLTHCSRLINTTVNRPPIYHAQQPIRNARQVIIQLISGKML